MWLLYWFELDLFKDCALVELEEESEGQVGVCVGLSDDFGDGEADGGIDAELWILGYIRSGDIEAKIDSINEVVVSSKGRQNAAEKYVDVIPTLSTFVNSLSRAIHGH